MLAINGGWTVTDHLLALEVDYLAILAWQGTKDGQKGRNKPKPLPRPGDKQRVESGRHGQAVSMTAAEARAWSKSRIAKK